MEILRSIIVIFVGSLLLASCNPFTDTPEQSSDGDLDIDFQDDAVDTEEEPDADQDQDSVETDGDSQEEEQPGEDEETEEETESESDIEYPPTDLLAWDGRMLLDCSYNRMLYSYRLKETTSGLTSGMAVYSGSISEDTLLADVPDEPEARYQQPLWSAQAERTDGYVDTVITPFVTDSAGEEIDTTRTIIFRRDRRNLYGGNSLWGLTTVRLPYLPNEEILAFAPAPNMTDWSTTKSAVLIISKEDADNSNLLIRRCPLSVQYGGAVTSTNPSCSDPQGLGLSDLDMKKYYIPGMMRPIAYRFATIINVINYIAFIDNSGAMMGFNVPTPKPDMGDQEIWVESMAAAPWWDGKYADKGEFLATSLIIPEGYYRGRYLCVFDLEVTDYSIYPTRRSCVQLPYTEAPFYMSWHRTTYGDAYLIAASADIADKTMVIANMSRTSARNDDYRKLERFSFGKPCADSKGNLVLSQPRTDGTLIAPVISSESLSAAFNSGRSMTRYYP